MITLKLYKLNIVLQPTQVFMISALIVNVGNYLYNLILGRLLGPEAFADAAILITFLLILSFVAMTLQLSVAKFIGTFDGNKKEAFLNCSTLTVSCGHFLSETTVANSSLSKNGAKRSEERLYTQVILSSLLLKAAAAPRHFASFRRRENLLEA